MFSSSTLSALLGAILVISSIPNATSYRKYGRTCKDIGCMRDQICVIAEDPCSIHQRDNCGSYPTCVKARPGEANCASTVCGDNEYCKTENGVPTCVKKSTAIVYPTQSPGRNRAPPPPPPPRSSSNGIGGRITGNAGSRNTIGDGSIFNRLFGNDRIYGSRGATTPRARAQPGGSGYYTSHTSVDSQGNRVWRFSG